MQKNIQIIDDAQNCAYSIYAISEEYFNLIFPNEGQDIEFIEDFVSRVGEEVAGLVIRSTWSGPIDKKCADGIHGTLFYGLAFKMRFYPNKKESDLG